VPISGRRSDVIDPDDMLPIRIEKLVAAAERRVFHFDSDSIWAACGEPSDRATLFGTKSMLSRGCSWLPLRIEFNNVRVHWPAFVTALQGAGFTISTAPKQGKLRSGRPTQATPRLAAPPRKRGRKPEKFDAVVARMRQDLEAGRLTPEALGERREKELAGDYQVSRDTARRARNNVLRNAPRNVSSRR
jgi:hypothetical protein